MQSHQLFHPQGRFPSSSAGLHDDQLRRQTIEQRTPSRDVPRNVMEALLAEEIDVQMQNLSLREQQTLQRSQIMGYALNRLPGLYVTSEKGWQRQWSQGKTKYQCQIKIAVRQGIAAVQRDPLRDVTVLSSHPPDSAEASLIQLRRLLTRPELSWHNIVATVQMLLVKGEMEFPDRRKSSPSASAPRFPGGSRASDRVVEEVVPVAPLDSEMDSVLRDFFDWDSHPLHQRGY